MPDRPDGDVISPAARRWHFLQECSGACGDLGTFIPHVIGAITVAGLGAAGVLFGFGVFLVSSGLFYGLPVPVQPMKAVSAVILTNGLRPGEIAAAGLLMGALLFALGVTGAIGRVARFIPQSVSAGLQLGLGILMGVLGIGLMLKTPWLGFGALALLLVLMRVPRCPAAPLMLVIVTLAGWSLAEISFPDGLQFAWSLPKLVIPSWEDVWRSVELAVIPQLPLTLTNAVIVTASLCREMFPADAARVSGAWRSPPEWPTSRSHPSVRCRCAMGRAGCRRNTGLVHAPAWRRCFSAGSCWSSDSVSQKAPGSFLPSFRLARSGRF